MHLSLQDGETALMKASTAGKVECIKVLLDRGAEVNMQDKVSGIINVVHMQCSMYLESKMITCAKKTCSVPMRRMKTATNLITCG